MREKYKNNRMWLFKRNKDNDPPYDLDGKPFFCNIVSKKVSIYDPMSNTWKSTKADVLMTTTQLDFDSFDGISDTSEPSLDDFSMIAQDGIDKKPYMERGNKHRRTKYWEYTLTIQ